MWTLWYKIVQGLSANTAATTPAAAGPANNGSYTDCGIRDAINSAPNGRVHYRDGYVLSIHRWGILYVFSFVG